MAAESLVGKVSGRGPERTHDMEGLLTNGTTTTLAQGHTPIRGSTDWSLSRELFIAVDAIKDGPMGKESGPFETERSTAGISLMEKLRNRAN